MKIVHVIASLGQGGAERVLVDLYNSKELKDHTQYIVMLSKTVAYGHLVRENSNVVVFEFEPNLSLFSRLFEVKSFFKKIQPDVVNFWLYKSIVLGGLLFPFKKNVFGHIHHNLQDYQNEKFFTKATIRLTKLIANLGLMRNFIFVSNRGYNYHKKFGLKMKNALVIPNGVDLTRFSMVTKNSRDQARQSLGIDMDALVIGNFGRFDPIKNHQLLVGGIADFKSKNPEVSVKLILAGSDVNENNKGLVALLEEFNLLDQTMLMDEVKKIENLYHALDLYALTSRSESFPMVLCEAMTTGIPCISTDVGDSVLILDKYGKIIDNDPASLSGCITEIIEHKSYYQSDAFRSESNDSVSSRFEMSKVHKQYEKVFDQYTSS
ncbi:glycosyltransferase [Roseivirga thermotolerans]|uniref:Glycosyl transferase n=1 Tax=Roseivirga thermotolerans TaxID=1758176 RepID=A0ABQ3I0P5_9BACT|nr:glycosyltransferase [Roseivirga thermotolerans]GHE53430.1 glycosyl transferase [Roseivirga thermotolerans]